MKAINCRHNQRQSIWLDHITRDLKPSAPPVLSVNGGSSSSKFALFEINRTQRRIVDGFGYWKEGNNENAKR